MQERVAGTPVPPEPAAADSVSVLRSLCLTYLDTGMSPRQVARLLGRSRQWVYRTKRSGSAGVRDRRRRVTSHLLEEAVRLREELGCGPAQAAALLRGRGLDAPSVAAIATEFRRRHIAPGRMPHTRIAPITRTPIARHGEELSVDIWGPWVVRGTHRVLALIGIDSFSRAAGGVLWQHLDAEAYARSVAHLVDRLYGNRWPARLLITHRLGTALTPLDGRLAWLVRLALSHGTLPIFLPAAQPWNIGRLQRFQATQEREFWRVLARTHDAREPREPYLDWLDYYNTQRVHAAIAPHTPAELTNGQYRPFSRRPEPPYLTPIAPHKGRIEYWRRVHTGGWIDLHGEWLRIQSRLIGQQVTIRLEIHPGQPGTGAILWRPDGRSEPIQVATLAHNYDGVPTQPHIPIRVTRYTWDIPGSFVPSNERSAP